ncbi:hypothetical protein Fot_16455 [Forsythia ovata]|uniref:Uncharacterized protein n=1 Tax=Forsythia ovata TaxID=205694 RepID=A0ABD1WCB4_9LAMI
MGKKNRGHSAAKKGSSAVPKPVCSQPLLAESLAPRLRRVASFPLDVQKSGTEKQPDGAVPTPNSMPDTPVADTGFQQKQPQSVENSAIIVSDGNQGRPTDFEGDAAFILVGRKNKFTASQKGKQQAKEQQSHLVNKGTSFRKSKDQGATKVAGSNDIPGWPRTTLLRCRNSIWEESFVAKATLAFQMCMSSVKIKMRHLGPTTQETRAHHTLKH